MTIPPDFDYLLSLQTGNVLPIRGKPPASESAIPFAPFNPFDPRSVSPDQASGDFNCVVELSAQLCLRVFDLDFQRTYFQLTISPSDLKAFFSGQTTPFDSHVLTELAATDPTQYTYVNNTYTPPKGLTLLLTLKPVSLSFNQGQAVEIGYRAVVAIGTLLPLHTSETLGTLDIAISASWHATPNPTLKQLDAFVDLTGAKITITAPPSDAGRMFAAGLFGPSGSQISGFLLHKSEVHVIPTFSLVGKDTFNAGVPEFPHFQASTSVVEWLGAQALALAFQLNSGCSPAIEDVQHFIGFYDYGVVSDELVVSGLFHHKWSLGGFLRKLPASGKIQITVDNKPEDATVYGALQLTSLDVVQINSDANSGGADYIGIGGNATTSIQSIVLAGGTVLTAGQSGVDFPPPQNVFWGQKGKPETNAQLPAGGLSKAFVQQAYRDAYRHLVRPFARFPDAAAEGADPVYVNYCRLEAIVHRVYALGTVGEVFV